MILRFVSFVVLWFVAVGSADALAQDCRQLPQGPARFACVSKNHPGAVAKLERCTEEGKQMGLSDTHNGPAGGLRPYVRACMNR